MYGYIIMDWEKDIKHRNLVNVCWGCMVRCYSEEVVKRNTLSIGGDGPVYVCLPCQKHVYKLPQ